MSTNNIQQSLLEAMQLLSSSAAGSTNASMTIKGEIVELLDKSTHAYSVSYGGTIYKDVYSISDAIYPPSTVVYLFIPDRTDFSKPKFILGAISPVASMYVTEKEEDTYIPIADNLFGELADVELKSAHSEEKKLIEDNVNFKQLFKNYLNTYNLFLFSAYIKTNIDKDHQQIGNYGLKLTLPFIQKIDGLSITKEYNMDTSNIPGNPYALTEFQKVDLYFEVLDTLEFDTSKNINLSAFVKDFGYYPVPTEEDAKVDIWIKDISFQMVDVLTPEQQLGYYATIVATEGNYFINNQSHAKTLTPILKVNSKDTKLNGWDCYWFVEDSSITITSEDYYSLGGLGWKCLNSKSNVQVDDEGRKTFQYNTNNYNLIVKFDDVIASLRYKCVLVKDDIVTQGFIKLTNLQSTIETQLVSATGSNTFIEDIGTVRLIARIYYDGITNQSELESNITKTLSTVWQRFDKNNNYIDNDFYTIIRENEQVTIDNKQYFETEITYSCSEVDKQNTIYCTFYRTITTDKIIQVPIYNSEGEETGEFEEQSIQFSTQSNLGTEHILVNTTNEYTYTVSLSGGDILYKYDADGDSPMVSNYDGPLTSKVKTIQPITFKIYKPDGSELTEDEYLYVGYRWSFPKNSMMKLEGYTPEKMEKLPQDDDYYYIEGKGLSNINYSIADTYNKKKSNNTILFYAVFDNTAIETTTNIKFLKDGESGTNGTKYSAVIEYDGYGYGDRDSQGRIRKFQAVYWEPKEINEEFEETWYRYDLDENTLVDFGQPSFKVIVYKDGIPYNQNLSYHWKLFEPSSSKDSFIIDEDTQTAATAILKVNLIEEKPVWNDTGQIIECAVTIINGDIGNRETLYVYYPLEVTKIKTTTPEIPSVIPHLEGGFEEVVYASDGTNPKFDNSNDFHCTDSIYSLDGQDNYFIYNWEMTENLSPSYDKEEDRYKATVKINPKTSFQNGESKNYVKVSLGLDDDHKAIIENEQAKINTKIEQDTNLLKYYDYKDEEHPSDGNLKYLISFLDEANTILDDQQININEIVDMLTLRQKMLEGINELRKILIDYYDYCQDKQVDTSKYNYIRIRTDLESKLTRAYRNIYLLGIKATLDNVNKNSSLDKTKIDTPAKGKLNDVIISQIQVYITNWDDLIRIYQQNWSELVAKVKDSNKYIYQEKYDILEGVHLALNEITIPNYLTNIKNPEKEIFSNLKVEIKAVLDSWSNYETGTLFGYQNYITDILDKITNLLYNYNQKERQEPFYDAKIEEIKADLEIQQTQYKAYATYLVENEGVIVHVKPILFLYNRYEFANINGWDGNKLYIDENNSQYLLAPQVGAGIKNSDNTFTGLVMGIRNFSDGSKGDVGLYGFVNGTPSILLNAFTGRAEFGTVNKIIIDPTKNTAKIQSGNYNYKEGDEGSGLMIDFKKPEIKFGTGYFEVSNQGYLKARRGDVGNWIIGENTLQSKNETITLDSNGNGKIYSNNHNSFNSSNDGFCISPDGLSIGSKLQADKEGNIYCNYIEAQVKGKIGGWFINGNQLQLGDDENSTMILDGSNGSITATSGSSKITFSPTGINLSGAATGLGFSLGANGLSFQNGAVNLTAGTNTGAIALTESKTQLGGVNIKNRIEKICADYIDVHILEADIAFTGVVKTQSINVEGNLVFKGEYCKWVPIDGLGTVMMANVGPTP